MSDHVDPLTAVRSLADIVRSLIERLDRLEGEALAVIRRVEELVQEVFGIESPEEDEQYETNNESF